MLSILMISAARPSAPGGWEPQRACYFSPATSPPPTDPHGSWQQAPQLSTTQSSWVRLARDTPTRLTSTAGRSSEVSAEERGRSDRRDEKVNLRHTAAKRPLVTAAGPEIEETILRSRQQDLLRGLAL